MRATHFLAAAALLIVGAIAPHLVHGQWAGIKRHDVLRNDLSAQGREVIQVLVEFEPGVSAPKHSHPGEELAYVIEGVFEYRLEGRAPVILKPGDSLFIPAGTPHAVTNVGNTKALELATYIVQKGKPLLIPSD